MSIQATVRSILGHQTDHNPMGPGLYIINYNAISPCISWSPHHFLLCCTQLKRQTQRSLGPSDPLNPSLDHQGAMSIHKTVFIECTPCNQCTDCGVGRPTVDIPAQGQGGQGVRRPHPPLDMFIIHGNQNGGGTTSLKVATHCP